MSNLNVCRQNAGKLFSKNSFILLITAIFVMSGFFVNTAKATSSGDVIVSEFVSDPVSGSEWVELLNTTSNPIDLTGWKIQDLTFSAGVITGTHDYLIGAVSIPANGILTFDVGTTKLNNDGDSIGLYDNVETPNLISRVTYGVVDGYIADLAAPSSGKSGVFNSGNWQTGQTPTKGWFNAGPAPTISEIVSIINAAGINTNMGTLSNPSAVVGLYFEKSGKGRITFNDTLNLTDQNTVTLIQALSSKLQMQTAGTIGLNPDACTTGPCTVPAPSVFKNVNATVSFYGVNALGYTAVPVFIVKNDSGVVISPSDTENYPTITDTSYSADNGGTISLKTNHFTQFSLDNTVYVDDSNSSGTEDGSQTNPYNTIQEGINSVPVGGLVDIAVGTYAESITINKTLTLDGAGNTTIINTAIDQDGIKITANDVVVKDLKVVTSNSGTTANIAIRIEGASGVEINNNVIETAGNKAMGIWVCGEGCVASNNLKIKKNTITIAGSATGIYAEKSATAPTGWVIGGSAEDSNTITMASTNVIELYDVSASEVSYNTFTITNAVDASNVMWFAELSNLVNLVFKENIISGSTGSEVAIGTDFRNIEPWNSITTVSVTGNTFSNWGTRALRLGNVGNGDGTVTGITINSNIFKMATDVEVIGGPATDKTSTTANIFEVTVPAKIQRAVDAAFPGDTINVAAGTYSENINVSKSLTLTGAASTTVAVTAASSASSVFNVTANSVDISEFTISGATGGGQAGIFLGTGVTGSNIHNNILTNNFDGIWLGSESNHNTLTANTLNSNYQGFELYHSDYNTFTKNIANSNNQYGFKMESADNNTFGSSNIADANDASLNGKYGFYLSAGSSNSDNNTFTKNTANSNTEYGMRINSSTGNTLTSNTFNLNIIADIRLKDTITSLTLDKNNFTNSQIGIDIASGAGSVTSWTVSNNNISGNTTSGISNLGTGVLSATQNWWGAVSGPKHSTTNSSATGDVISDNVIYSKWCTNLACTEFGSNSALSGYSVSTSPGDSVVLPNSITLTIKAVDADGIFLVNNSTEKVSLTADRGAAFGSNLLTFSNGSTSTTVSNTAIGLVNVSVVQVGGSITTTKQLSFNLNDSADLAITGTAMEKSFAIADDDFADGWRWKLDVTVPTSETNLKIKFADWVGGTNSVAAAQNIRFFSAQSGDAIDASHAVTIMEANSYSSALSLNSDLDITKAGRQIQIIVETKVPVGSVGGSYSTSYGIESN